MYVKNAAKVAKSFWIKTEDKVHLFRYSSVYHQDRFHQISRAQELKEPKVKILVITPSKHNMTLKALLQKNIQILRIPCFSDFFRRASCVLYA